MIGTIPIPGGWPVFNGGNSDQRIAAQHACARAERGKVPNDKEQSSPPQTQDKRLRCPVFAALPPLAHTMLDSRTGSAATALGRYRSKADVVTRPRIGLITITADPAGPLLSR